MGARLAEDPKLAARRKQNYERDRVEFKAEPEWINQVVETADRLGMGLSAFIRFCVTRVMNDPNVVPPEKPAPPKGKGK